MASESEPLINVVSFGEPNALIGSSQNGTWPGISACRSEIADVTATGEKAGPNPPVSPTRNRVSPYLCWKTSKPTVRKADGDAGRGRRRKRMPLCNGADTGLNVTGRESEQTSAHGALSRESCGTFEGRKANERDG